MVLRFSYTGRNSQGKIVEGFIEGINHDTVTAALKKNGVVPILLRLSQCKPSILQQGLSLVLAIAAKPKLEDLIAFSRQMYSLIKAGVPLLRAIKTITDNIKSESLRIALEDVLVRLYGGQSLSAAVGKHPNVFPGLMQSLINVGENTGNLDEMFRQIMVYLEREYDTTRRIKTAMRYPIMVIAVIMVAIGIINILVVPAFAQFFQRFGAALPLPTRILIGTSNFMVGYWYVVVLSIVAAIVSWRNYIRTAPGRMKWDRIKLKIPLVGSIIERALLARFVRSFAVTSRTGVPLIDAIEIIAKTTDNCFVAERIMLMRHSIEHGESLAIAAQCSGMFSSLVMQMITIGEETGEIDKLLEDVADFYERELDYDLKKISETIEPILVVIIAGMVLILALGVFLPMWDLSKVALSK